MRRLVSSQAALAADRAAEQEFGYPPHLLMEEAGIRLQDALEGLEFGAKGSGPVVYLVGSGNNGGDAWVMARQSFLRRPTSVAVVRVFPANSESCRLQEGWGLAIGLKVFDWPSPEATEVLASALVWVDGVWGTGLQGPVRSDRGQTLLALEELRARKGKSVVAVDVASGLYAGRKDSEPVLKAVWTLTPGPLKAFCFHPANRAASGVLREVPLAFPRAAEVEALLWEEDDLADLLPPVAVHDHKGKRGHVALVGGAPGMTGALVMAARSAASAGAGLISLGVDSNLIPLVAPGVPAFQVRPTHELLDQVSRYDSLVVGPGWGRAEDRLGLLELVWSTNLPLVLDADALAAWSAAGEPPRSHPTVLTPHPGEFRRLTGQSEASVEGASDLAQAKGVVVVLKGSTTWILAPDGRRAAWDGAEPALGTGGSGDCLAGILGALLAAGQPAFEAALGAVALHGTAGRRLAKQEGWFTADRLPTVLGQVALACRTAPRPL